MPSSTIEPPVAAGLPVVGDADGSEPRVIMIGLATYMSTPGSVGFLTIFRLSSLPPSWQTCEGTA